MMVITATPTISGTWYEVNGELLPEDVVARVRGPEYSHYRRAVEVEITVDLLQSAVDSILGQIKSDDSHAFSRLVGVDRYGDKPRIYAWEKEGIDVQTRGCKAATIKNRLDDAIKGARDEFSESKDWVEGKVAALTKQLSSRILTAVFRMQADVIQSAKNAMRETWRPWAETLVPQELILAKSTLSASIEAMKASLSEIDAKITKLIPQAFIDALDNDGWRTDENGTVHTMPASYREEVKRLALEDGAWKSSRLM